MASKRPIERRTVINQPNHAEMMTNGNVVSNAMIRRPNGDGEVDSQNHVLEYSFSSFSELARKR
jgi:hypothetical protein